MSGRLEVAVQSKAAGVSRYKEYTHPFGRTVTLLSHITVTVQTDEQRSSSILLKPFVNICDLVHRNNTWGINTIDCMLQSKGNCRYTQLLYPENGRACSSETSTKLDGLIRSEHLRYRVRSCRHLKLCSIEW